MGRDTTTSTGAGVGAGEVEEGCGNKVRGDEVRSSSRWEKPAENRLLVSEIVRNITCVSLKIRFIIQLRINSDTPLFYIGVSLKCESR